MKQFTYTITDPEGMHARPAGALVKAANEFTSSVQIGKDGKFVDAKRIFGIMSLGIKCGNEVTMQIEGDDEDAACQALETFLKENM